MRRLATAFSAAAETCPAPSVLPRRTLDAHAGRAGPTRTLDTEMDVARVSAPDLREV